MSAPSEHPEAAERVATFRLARDLGMTVETLERELSQREFGEWVAFYNAEAKFHALKQKQAEAEARRNSRGRRR